MGAILLVDDDAAVRILLRAICEREGLEVVEARNGQQALEALSVRPFDVVILDLMMSPMSGSEVLTHLAEAQPCRRNVIVLTAASPAISDQVNHHCVHAVIRKPFDLDELLSTIRAAARREVLVVEDNPVHQYLIERMLKNAGYGVVLAGTGLTALQQLTARGFDAMVLDINLPEVSGYDVMNAVQSMFASMPVVVLTILETLERELAADAVLHKHRGFDELVPTLRNVLGQDGSTHTSTV